MLSGGLHRWQPFSLPLAVHAARSSTARAQGLAYTTCRSSPPTTTLENSSTAGTTSNRHRRGELAASLRSRGSRTPQPRHRVNQQCTRQKKITAYCAAKGYLLSEARQLLEQSGFRADAVQTGLEANVLHIQTTATLEKASGSSADPTTITRGDVFIFPSGSAVTWDVSSDVADHIVNHILRDAADKPHAQAEIEDFAYLERSDSHTSKIVGDTISLGTGASSTSSSSSGNSNRHTSRSTPGIAQPRTDVTLTQIAYSSALARSAQLARLEELLSSYFETTRDIPAILSAGSALPYTRSFILRKTGDLLSIRAQLNLYSELTDSLPDLFWDTPHELGLEQCYESLGRALDIGVRIRVLNQKMDYASEIAAVLRERLSEKHSTGLEWLIIGLISIEVAFGIFGIVKESQEQEELSRVRRLLERYLEMALDGERSVIAK